MSIDVNPTSCSSVEPQCREHVGLSPCAGDRTGVGLSDGIKGAWSVWVSVS